MNIKEIREHYGLTQNQLAKGNRDTPKFIRAADTSLMNFRMC